MLATITYITISNDACQTIFANQIVFRILAETSDRVGLYFVRNTGWGILNFVWDEKSDGLGSGVSFWELGITYISISGIVVVSSFREFKYVNKIIRQTIVFILKI